MLNRVLLCFPVQQYSMENGEGGIRTHDDFRHNCLAGSPVQPLLHLSRYVAVGVGFEPTVTCATTVFKTAAFVHSAIPPIFVKELILILTYNNPFVKRICV